MSKFKARILIATLVWSLVAIGVQMRAISTLRDDVRTLSASNLSLQLQLQKAVTIAHRAHAPVEVVP